MVFRKHQRKIMGRFGRKEMKCSECGTVIEYGDVYYTRTTKKKYAKNFSRIICENCYEKSYITI